MNYFGNSLVNASTHVSLCPPPRLSVSAPCDLRRSDLWWIDYRFSLWIEVHQDQLARLPVCEIFMNFKFWFCLSKLRLLSRASTGDFLKEHKSHKSVNTMYENRNLYSCSQMPIGLLIQPHNMVYDYFISPWKVCFRKSAWSKECQCGPTISRATVKHFARLIAYAYIFLTSTRLQASGQGVTFWYAYIQSQQISVLSFDITWPNFSKPRSDRKAE
jgi:hypothetical protein